MGRIARKGFEYYRAETDRFRDIKIRKLRKEHSCAGYAIYQYVLNEIYRVEGCYIRFTQDELFDCAEYWNMREEEVLRIINYCTETGAVQCRNLETVRHSDRALHPDPICVHVSRGQAQDSHSGRNKSSFRRKILLPGFPGTAPCGSGVRSDLWICGSHLCSLHGTFRSARSFERGDSSGKNRIYSGRIREYSGSLQYKGKKKKTYHPQAPLHPFRKRRMRRTIPSGL